MIDRWPWGGGAALGIKTASRVEEGLTQTGRRPTKNGRRTEEEQTARRRTEEQANRRANVEEKKRRRAESANPRRVVGSGKRVSNGEVLESIGLSARVVPVK